MIEQRQPGGCCPRPDPLDSSVHLCGRAARAAASDGLEPQAPEPQLRRHQHQLAARQALARIDRARTATALAPAPSRPGLTTTAATELRSKNCSKNTTTTSTTAAWLDDAPPAAMMDVNAVPSVVIHFNGFRSSLLANVGDALFRVMFDVVHRTAVATLKVIGATIAVYQATQQAARFVQMVALLPYRLTMASVSFTVFMTLETLAVVFGKKHSTLLQGAVKLPTLSFMAAEKAPEEEKPIEKIEPAVELYEKTTFDGEMTATVETEMTPTIEALLKTIPVATPVALFDTPQAVPLLPLLAVPATVAILPETPGEQPTYERQNCKSQIAIVVERPARDLPARPSMQLTAVRRRILEQHRMPCAIVNSAHGERRRRADVCLHKAKIRVGKAFLDPVMRAAAANGNTKCKPQDMYMVRVDCSTPDDKHMNPVVMWDFTATFEEFRKLEKELRKEIKAKRLRNIEVPHLWSGAILFVQPELTQDVLSVRRQRLQKFVDQIQANVVLADAEVMRKFCQAF